VCASRHGNIWGATMSHPAVGIRGDSVTIRIKVHPRAKKNAITGLVGDAVKLSLTSPPVDGKANQACIEFFAELLNVSRRAVSIIAGQTGRAKVIQIAGVTLDRVEAALAEAADLQ
jgi:uncharacterized protein (TIGR00251 family)